MTDKPTDDSLEDLIHELYARFGLAYFHSECLHRGLCIIHALAGLPSRALTTRPRIEERFAAAFTLTLGAVTQALEGILPEDLYEEVARAVEQRNFLAHHFWFDRAHLMFEATNVEGLIAELDTYSELFSRLDEKTDAWYEHKRQELGLTEEHLQDYLAKITAGQADEPLPDKEMVRRLQRTLQRPQRLVRVWEHTVDDGGKPLVFELADGTLWQLCDVGLGWTRYQTVGTEWTEQAAIKPYLPAEIVGRPKCTGPWEYEFTLARGTILWVRPGRRPGTFKWDLRKPKATPTTAQ